MKQANQKMRENDEVLHAHKELHMTKYCSNLLRASNEIKCELRYFIQNPSQIHSHIFKMYEHNKQLRSYLDIHDNFHKYKQRCIA